MAAPVASREQTEMFLAKPRFHQTVTIPEGDGHGSIVISYAEYGCYTNSENKQDGTLASINSADVPTVLFMPGMFASRYSGASMHAIAEKQGVRVLVPDRFGFGQTANVALEERVPLWVVLMPKFLNALNLDHVALVSHGAGSIFNLNLVWHCRNVLHPGNPVVFFLAPWVDTAHSKTSLGRAVQAVPTAAIKKWNKIAKVIGLRVGGSVGIPSGILAKMVKVMTFGVSKRGQNIPADDDTDIDGGIQMELGALATKAMFNENTAGANSEAMLCLKKGPEGTWGEAEDMNGLVKKIMEKEAENRPEGQKKLTVNLYFAEHDVLVGKKGQQYFQSCWLGNDAAAGDGVDVNVTTVEKCNHDSITGHAGVLNSVFQAVAGMNAADDENEVVEASEDTAGASD